MFNFIKTITSQLRSFTACQLCGVDHQIQHSLCADCWQSLPWLKQNIVRQKMEIQVACHYSYPLDQLIQKFKYEHQLNYQLILAGLFTTLRFPKVQAIVPMPISEARLIERGFNQSHILAEHLAKHLNIPIWQPILRHAEHSQKGLNRLERLENINEQFEIDPTNTQKFRRVLILDDVVTTGSSIHALKLKLEELGCSKIYATCLACAEH